MKKLTTMMLVIALLISSISIIPVSADPTVTFYVNHDFNTVEGVKEVTVTNIAPDPLTQKQYEILGESYPWRTATYTATSSPSFSYAPNGDEAVDPQPYNNNSGYIKTSGKNQYPQMSMEMKNPVTEEIEATSGDQGFLYVDIRIKRMSSISEHSDIRFYDSNGNIISILRLVKSSAPRLNTISDTGGTVTTTTIGNGTGTEWWYYKQIYDFNTKTMQAFIGETLDTLEPFRSDTTTYNFHNSSASNFYKVAIGVANYAKSAFSFDDFKVYSISGVAAPAAEVTLTGKANIGGELSASYVYSEPLLNEEEGDSIGYWEVSDDAAFINATKLGSDIPMKAGDTSTYTITENESGKYVRFCVIPKSIGGAEGTICKSSSTGQIDVFIIGSLSTSGSVNGSQFEYKNYSATYKGRVHIYNSTLEEKELTLITVWFNENNELVQVNTDHIIIPSGAEMENGTVNTTYSNSEGRFATSKESLYGLTMKVLVWDGFTVLQPLKSPYVITGVRA